MRAAACQAKLGRMHAAVPAQPLCTHPHPRYRLDRATNGVVVGAGKLGLVKKPAVAKKAAAPTAAAVVTPAAAPDPSRPGQDQDGDGASEAVSYWSWDQLVVCAACC